MKRLLIRPGAIGDFVVSIPAMECLRGDYLEVWAAARNVPLARFADHARAISSTGLDLLELCQPHPKLVETLRGFDSIVSWYGANRPEFRDAWWRTLQRAGGHCSARSQPELSTLPIHFFPAIPPEGCEAHAVDFYLDQARSIGGCVSDGIPRIAVPPAARGNFAVIHPFSGSRKKCWPIDRFREIARTLQRRMEVQWCAGPEEDLPGAVRFDNLYELACWLAKARIYIGNDSGPTHIAAAVGAPVVALFGPSNPAVWAPRGPQVAIASAASIDGIPVKQVENLVYHTLGGAI